MNTDLKNLRFVEIVMIGCSAGGVEALKAVLPEIPPDLPCPVVIVQHIGAHFQSTLAQYFGGLCSQPVKEAEDKEPIQKGIIYFAPGGYHLSVERDRCFALSVDPPVNFARPSIDVLMESAVEAYGPRSLGILLTGANQDGANGLLAVRQAGGIVVVQDPRTAEFDVMPQAALQLLRDPLILSLGEISCLLKDLKRNEEHSFP